MTRQTKNKGVQRQLLTANAELPPASTRENYVHIGDGTFEGNLAALLSAINPTVLADFQRTFRVTERNHVTTTPDTDAMTEFPISRDA